MAAFFVGAGMIKDMAAFQEYSAGTPATFALFGGEILTRGGKSHDLTGSGGADMVIVVRFKDMETLDAWYASDEYQALLPLREKALDLTITAYNEPS